MNNGFDLKQVQIVDPGRVRNFLFDAKNDSTRKNYGSLFHLVYAVVCAVIIYLAASSATFSILPCCIASAMCVFTILYSPTAFKFIPVIFPLAANLIITAINGFKGGYIAIAAFCFIYLLCLASSAAIAKAVLSGYTKNSVFVTLSVIYGVTILCIIVFSFISTEGSFSMKMISESVNGYFSAVVEKTKELASSEEGYKMLTMFYPADKVPAQEEAVKMLTESVQITCDAIKLCLPSIFALSCMLYGFITVICFSVVAKTFKINVFVSIMDSFWTYRPSSVTAVVYDILFFALILGMFLPFSQNASAMIINLLIIITPIMSISGFRGIYSFFRKKTQNKPLSVIITAAITLVLLMVLGVVTALVLASVGVHYVTARKREEAILFPVKYASDRELYEKLYADKKDSGEQ